MTVEIFCTRKCNWNCYYCCEDIHNSKKDPSEQDIKDKIINNKNNNIILSGGEPGLLSKSLIEWIFNNHNNISINTNGLFLERYSYYISKCKRIYYHCSKDLDYIEKIYDYDNIEYLIIVTDNNIDKLDKFLKQYHNIIFDVIPCDMPKSVSNYKNLSNENKLIDIIINNKNINKKTLFYNKNKLRYKLKTFI